jgi:hypothetical protein
VEPAPPLLSDVRFGSFLVYSPRGQSPMSRSSRVARDRVKNARLDDVRRIVERLHEEFPTSSLNEVLGPDLALVPAPRSAPLVPGALWPAQRIADALVRHGFGSEVIPLVSRSTAVPKSAYASPGNRPMPHDHLASLHVEPTLARPATITIVDDVITKGATLLAAASLLRAHYPESDVRAFAVLRTLGLQPDIDQIIAPVVGTVTLTAWGDAHREP